MARVMAKIMKRAPQKTETARYHHKSDKCGSDIEFYRSDIHLDARDGDYVICPACESWINVSLLHWDWTS